MLLTILILFLLVYGFLAAFLTIQGLNLPKGDKTRVGWFFLAAVLLAGLLVFLTLYAHYEHGIIRLT